MNDPNPPPRVPGQHVQPGPVYDDVDLDDLGISQGRVSALVVHESSFGNTHRVALAVAEGVAAALPEDASVAVVRADRCDPAAAGEVRMLFVGAPTHAFS